MTAVIMDVFYLWCSLWLSFSWLASSERVIPHEPISIVKSLLVTPTERELGYWSPLVRSISVKRDKLISEINKHASHLVEFSSFALSVEDEVLIAIFPPDMRWNTSYNIPTSNLITFMSSSLSILMDGFKPGVLVKPLQELSQQTKTSIPDKFNYHTLFQLLGKIPEVPPLNDKGFIKEYNIQSHVTFEIINGLLGESWSEAWRDAFISLQLDNAKFSGKKHITASFDDLQKFSEVVQLDIKTTSDVPPPDMYDHSDHYAYGWWINQDQQGSKLFEALPGDAMLSFSSSIRIYIIPSLKLSAVLASTPVTSWSTRSFEEFLFLDNQLWTQILMTVSPEYHDKIMKERREKESESSGDTANNMDDEVPSNILSYVWSKIWDGLVAFFNFTGSLPVTVRVLMFTVFVVIGKFTVYNSFYVLWQILAFIFVAVRNPRPARSKRE
jgi:hypothetical protein